MLDNLHRVMNQTKTCPMCNGLGRVRDERTFGKEMQEKRKAAHVKLREVAAHMEKSVSYVSDLEHGRKKWRGGLIVAYVDALEVLGDPQKTAR